MDEKKVLPTGAIAFFAAMMLFYGVVWVSMYVLAVVRG